MRGEERRTMPLPEYVLLATLATGIHPSGGADGILSIGPEVITQPNGGAPVVLATDADKHYPNAAVTGHWGTVKTPIVPGVTVTSPGASTPPAHPPTIRTPIIRTPVVR